MSSEDEFMEIIQNSNLENLNRLDLTVKDLHVGLKGLATSMMIITEFIDEFFTSFETEQEKPKFSENAIVFAKEMFIFAEKFCDEFYDNEYIDDDEDDDDDSDEDFFNLDDDDGDDD